MALWVAGLGFVCHGEALDEKYDGDMLRPSDMKQIVTRFYNTKRTRRQKVPDVGGLDLTHEHVDDDVVGDVHHMYITKDMGLMNIARITPVTETGKNVISRVKNATTSKGKPVGLSYDFAWVEIGTGEEKRTANKYIKKLSIVEEPAHHSDGTYIVECAENEEELLKKLFGGIYGPDANEKSGEPFHITNALRSQVKSLFTEDKEGAATAPVEKKKETEKTIEKELVAPTEKKKEVGKATEKETMASVEKKMIADKKEVVLPEKKVADEKALIENDPMDLDTDASKDVAAPMTDATTNESKEIATNEDDMEIDPAGDTTKDGSDPKTPPTSGGETEGAPGNQRAPVPLFTNKGDKDIKPSKETVSSLPLASNTKPVLPSGTSAPQTVGKKHPEPKQKKMSTTENGNNNTDAGNNDNMDIDDTAKTSTQGKAGNERKTDTGAVKRTLNSVNNNNNNNNNNGKQASDDNIDENNNEGDDMDENDKPATEPAGKKSKVGEGVAKPTASSYGLTPRDADIQMKSLNSSFQELMKWANLASAGPEEQQAYIQNMVDSQKKQLMEQQKSTDLTIRTLLSNAGLKDDAINSFVEASNANDQVGQAVRTMAAAATVGGMNHRLAEIAYQNQKGNEASLLDMANAAAANRRVDSSASIFNGNGTMKRDAPATLDFSASIFGYQQQQAPASQQQQSHNRRTNVNNQQQQYQQRQGVDRDRRVGGASAPVISPEEQARRDEEKRNEEYRKSLEVTGSRVVRTIPFDPLSPIFSIRDEYGQLALDTQDLRPELLNNITMDGFTHRFMSALKMNGTRSPDNNEARVTYGDDKTNDVYYERLTGRDAGYRAPRLIRSGAVTIGSDEIRNRAIATGYKDD